MGQSKENAKRASDAETKVLVEKTRGVRIGGFRPTAYSDCHQELSQRLKGFGEDLEITGSPQKRDEEKQNKEQRISPQQNKLRQQVEGNEVDNILNDLLQGHAQQSPGQGLPRLQKPAEQLFKIDRLGLTGDREGADRQAPHQVASPSPDPVQDDEGLNRKKDTVSTKQ